MTVQVREAAEADRPAVAAINQAAFGAEEGPVIVGLMDELLADPTAEPRLCLVATVAEQVVGYILFTSARLEPAQPEVAASLLAPMAVHPDHQNQGIGGRLIQEGLARLQAAGVDLVFVLGHVGFYPKFGFTPAGAEGFEAMYPIPPENADAWMVQALHREGTGRAHGRVVAADALDDPAYWIE